MFVGEAPPDPPPPRPFTGVHTCVPPLREPCQGSQPGLHTTTNYSPAASNPTDMPLNCYETFYGIALMIVVYIKHNSGRLYTAWD